MCMPGFVMASSVDGLADCLYLLASVNDTLRVLAYKCLCESVFSSFWYLQKSDTGQDHEVLPPRPLPCLLSVKNFSQRLSLIREMRICGNKRKTVEYSLSIVKDL